jgi:tetratricopeptide (TPR) repeat protein
VRARERSLTPIAAGAYVAFLVHAGVDWDWELSAVTLAGLLCGVAVMIAARSDGNSVDLGRSRYALAGLGAAVTAVAIIGLLGNIPLSHAGKAVRAGKWAEARSEARKAIRWEPWSADGWRRLGQAELGLHQLTAARRDLRTAIQKDPRNWDRWFDLALATSGTERRRAIESALALNPHSPEIAEFISGVGLKGIRVRRTRGG